MSERFSNRFRSERRGQYHITRARPPVEGGAVVLSESAAAPRGDDIAEARGAKDAEKITSSHGHEFVYTLLGMQPEFDRQQLDRINQHCYDNCSSNWDRFPFPQFLPDLILKYHDPQLGSRVLDIGSGTGQVAAWLMQQGFDVHCIDPSPEMVRLCKEKGLATQQITIQEYDVKTSFSMILAILSLIHVPKSEFPAQIEKIHSLLPHDGLFVLCLLEGSHEGIEEKASGYPRFFTRYTPQEIRKIFANTFREIDFRSVSYGSINYLTFFLRKI